MTQFGDIQNQATLSKRIDEFFRENPDEIWVKATTDMQVVLSGNDANVKLGIPPIQPGDPVNLSYRATIEDLKRSDLRRMVQRGVLKLMTFDEVKVFFDKKAARLEVSAEEVKKRAIERDKEFLETTYKVTDRRGTRGEDIMKIEREGDDDAPGDTGTNPTLRPLAVKPKIIHLCQSSSDKLDAADRKPAKLLLEEFGDIEDSLTEADLRHIIANVQYKTVKSWAKKRLEGEDEAESDE